MFTNSGIARRQSIFSSVGDSNSSSGLPSWDWRVGRVLLDAADEIECSVQRLVILRIRRPWRYPWYYYGLMHFPDYGNVLVPGARTISRTPAYVREG